MKPVSYILVFLFLLADIRLAWSSDACSTVAITTAADVSASDGTSFRTESFFHSYAGAAIRHMDNRDRTIAVEGPVSWMRDDDSVSLGNEFHKNFALGHQFHALLLHFDDIASNLRQTRQVQFGESTHLATTGDYPYGGSIHLIHNDDGGRPLGVVLEPQDAAPITVVFLDWREQDGVALPFHVRIDDGERVFDYHYTMIDTAPKSPLWFFESVSPPDIDSLLVYRVHRKLLAAHCLGDATLMSSLSTADIVIANRGEIVRTTDAEMRDRFTAAFKRFDYTGYRDIATPIIEISQAGDAGWIWVNVRAAGKDLVSGEAFDDQWAWLMLLKNVDGRWLHAGNASNLAE